MRQLLIKRPSTHSANPFESVTFSFSSQYFKSDVTSIDLSEGLYAAVASSTKVESYASAICDLSILTSKPEDLTQHDCKDIFYRALIDDRGESSILDDRVVYSNRYRILSIICNSTDGSLNFLLNQRGDPFITFRLPAKAFHQLPTFMLQLNSRESPESVNLFFGEEGHALRITYENKFATERYILNHAEVNGHTTWHLIESESII